MTTFSFYRQKKHSKLDIHIFYRKKPKKNCHTCHWIRKNPENWGLSNDSLCDRNDSFAAGVTVPPIRSNCSRTRGTGQGVKKPPQACPGMGRNHAAQETARATCSGGVFLSRFTLWNRFNIARHVSTHQDSLGKHPHRQTHQCTLQKCKIRCIDNTVLVPVRHLPVDQG